MRRWIVLVCISLFALPAMALVVRQNGNLTIEANQVINDDLVVSGGTLRILGKVTGDLVVAGGNVEIDGPIGGDLIAAGGTIIARSPIGASAYVAGGTIDLDSTVARNLAVTGGTVRVGSTATVGRDLAVSGGNVTLEGKVTRNVMANTGTLTLTDQARVGGNLNAMTSKSSIAPGAVIVGTRMISPPHGRYYGRHRFWGKWAIWKLFTGIALLIVGLIFVAAAPRLTEQSLVVLRRHPWASLLVGFLTLIIVPLAILIILFTCIGIPLAVILLWVYLIAVYLGPIFVAILVGRLVWRRPAGNLYVALLIGIALLIVVRWIPVLGNFISFLAMLFGLGALLLAIQGRSAHPYFPPAAPATPTTPTTPVEPSPTMPTAPEPPHANE